MCEHRMKFKRQSAVYYKGKTVEVDIYECQECQGLMFINTKTDGYISFDGAMGKEIIYDR